MYFLKIIIYSLFLTSESLNFNLTRRKITGVSIGSVFGKKMSNEPDFYPIDNRDTNSNKYNILMDEEETETTETTETTENTNDETHILKMKNNIIRFYGPVNTMSCLRLQYILNEIEDKEEIDIVHLHIQSNGGELLPSFFVSDYIKTMKTPVYTYIDSYAASAATILSIAGKKRFMSEHSIILIHQLSTQISGNFNKLNVEVRNLDTIMSLAKNIYLQNSKMDSETLDNLLATDLWLNSTTALNLGLIDEII
tara:strand:+ start:7558 stop:8316 length:759 start_codon:yes stop_codon:yes gene_type:complete